MLLTAQCPMTQQVMLVNPGDVLAVFIPQQLVQQTSITSLISLTLKSERQFFCYKLIVYPRGRVQPDHVN